MSPPPFALFGHDHLAALALVGLATAVAVALVRRWPDSPAARALRIALAAALIALYAAEMAVAGAGGWLSWQVGLPLHLCDVALFLAIVALLAPRLAAHEGLYFLALSGTLLSLLTPELAWGFPSWDFFIFFVPHGLVVLSAVVLTWGYRLVPRPGAWWRVLLALHPYAGGVFLVNLWLDTNFLYLRRKPVDASPLDWFGPWPFYIFTGQAVAAVLFFLLDLPLRPLRRRIASAA
ncbi:MAG TPA: TIGR02206 family membrane protein [Vicinamibacteria bacterium]|nr:TIGR02206 family membrane protein [Vicinamibacteria bacterium]